MTTKKYTAESIKVLKGLEAVRKRPAMYIGSTSIDGLHHLVYEVVDNSIDEALAGFCSRVDVTIHEDNTITVVDDGRGIPVGMHKSVRKPAAEVVITMLHAGGKFDQKSYQVSGGLHGVGVSVVNALSEWCRAEIKRDHKIHRQSYSFGDKDKDIEIVGETERTGTKITFKPDPNIFTETQEYKYDIIQNRLRELAFLNKGVKIVLHDERNGAQDEFHYEGGINQFVEYLNRNRTPVNPEPIFFEGEKDDVQVEVCFQYYTGYTERLYSFVNNIHTKEGGTHVTGFRGALTKCINRYATDDIIPKNMKEKIT